jgi:hypothetical protein
MTRAGALFVALLLLASAAQAEETPPYDPAPPANKMTAYTNSELGFTISYPKEFIAGTLQDLQNVMERGHRAAYGTDPKSDPEHLEAVRCMHTLFYATSQADTTETNPNSPGASADDSPDSILVEDVDRSCLPKNLKGDKALTQIAGSVLHAPDLTQLVQQMWFVAGGDRHIHSGMAGAMVTIKQPQTDGSPTGTSREVPLYVMASALEQKQHWILVVYLSGTGGAKHLSVPHMSIAFEDSRPILLFPFLLGNVNLTK